MSRALLLALGGLAACRASAPPPVAATGPAPATAPVLVYQTRAYYADLVPVQLSADGRQVLSYPDPADLRGPDPRPVPLGSGYWLDQRGIGPQTAFLRLTYAQYARRASPPPLDSLRLLILDAHPLRRLCSCGPRQGYAPDPAPELRRLIASGRLVTRCRVLLDSTAGR